VTPTLNPTIPTPPPNTPTPTDTPPQPPDANPVIILGFGPPAQLIANMLSSPLATPEGATAPLSYLAFDLNPARAAAARAAGFPVVYGDGARVNVLHAAGVERPRAAAVCHHRHGRNLTAVELLAAAFPGVKIYATARTFRWAAGGAGWMAARDSIADVMITLTCCLLCHRAHHPGRPPPSRPRAPTASPSRAARPASTSGPAC
jgi:hypothetical protein